MYLFQIKGIEIKQGCDFEKERLLLELHQS
nr:MAG TPA: hypothetical protein [Caudoviricetes sp.]